MTTPTSTDIADQKLCGLLPHVLQRLFADPAAMKQIRDKVAAGGTFESALAEVFGGAALTHEMDLAGWISDVIEPALADCLRWLGDGLANENKEAKFGFVLSKEQKIVITSTEAGHPYIVLHAPACRSN